ncbi:MAG TPA: hypothetical protein VMS31_01085 [Pyrinomonadaceae bacterium]|nr:hypothetical protein [Pyrinomonadaceae bacterium]
MERTANLEVATWPAGRSARGQLNARLFVSVLLGCALLSAGLASWLPLQVSIVTVFLFAGPHNWFELRYFLMRLPVRFGRSRSFFLVAFAGIGLLTITYLSLPVLYSFGIASGDGWSTILASWNTLLLLWLALLVWLRGKQKLRRDWSWAFAAALGLVSLNWLRPEFFSLAIVYLHPLVALWFLDRHLRRARPEWLGAYRRCLCLLPLLLAGMIWQLTRTPSLPDDNGLFWRITQHAGAELLPGVSSRLLVSVHLFLEMLHYAVWLLALPLIEPLTRSATQPKTMETQPRPRLNSGQLSARRIWNVKTVPLARHPRGFPRLVATTLAFGVFLVAILWFGFAVDYSTTRDVYFTVAIAHVLAEAPFLLKML